MIGHPVAREDDRVTGEALVGASANVTDGHAFDSLLTVDLGERRHRAQGKAVVDAGGPIDGRERRRRRRVGEHRDRPTAGMRDRHHGGVRPVAR